MANTRAACAGPSTDAARTRLRNNKSHSRDTHIFTHTGRMKKRKIGRLFLSPFDVERRTTTTTHHPRPTVHLPKHPVLGRIHAFQVLLRTARHLRSVSVVDGWRFRRCLTTWTQRGARDYQEGGGKGQDASSIPTSPLPAHEYDVVRASKALRLTQRQALRLALRYMSRRCRPRLRR